ncbi:hypothetical protein N7495_007531 [Penicillium taxi]|uniref:uncharacterized protein n=1 Tax=Penicillium taxi TaxID=168475 RepID=UPI0025450FE8|nr:uncharacterized protein N7495_007531 [Penicillium taxi]KAJ5887490.1 hypothetical protein N7495_007531 [Penicillium taxi]
MLLLWRLAAIALWVTASSASFYYKYCEAFPDNTIEYCFEDVSDDSQAYFNAAVNIWTSSGIPVTYKNIGACPNSDSSSDLSKMLIVSTWYETYHSSSYGYRYAQTGDFQYLKIGLWYNTHTTAIGKKKAIIGSLVHELGRVMCLLNENQRPDLADELTWNCKNLADYSLAKSSAAKQKVLDGCDGIAAAASARSYGAWTYAPYPSGNEQYELSDSVDYNSVMFVNGIPQSKSKLAGSTRVITTKAGKKITGSVWYDGPSAKDIAAIEAICEERPPELPARPETNVEDSDPVPPYVEFEEQPPDYECW